MESYDCSFGDCSGTLRFLGTEGGHQIYTCLSCGSFYRLTSGGITGRSAKLEMVNRVVEAREYEKIYQNELASLEESVGGETVKGNIGLNPPLRVIEPLRGKISGRLIDEAKKD